MRYQAAWARDSPDLAVGDGALGFWKAIEEVFPGTRCQRCWVHKTANVLNKVALSGQLNMKADLREITARLPAQRPPTNTAPSTTRCLSNKTALAMIFKLAEAAEKSWRRLDGHKQVPPFVAAAITIARLQSHAQSDYPNRIVC